VSLDSLREYSPLTSDFTAEFGRADAGIVNVVTKSGSNEFHGTTYEFNRVSGLASNSLYNGSNELPKGNYTRNQFGYSIGGPIVKNRLFFFEDTERIRVRSGQDQVAWVPTPQLIAASAPVTREFCQAYGKLRSGLNALSTYAEDDMVAAGPPQPAATGGEPGEPDPVYERVDGGEFPWLVDRFPRLQRVRAGQLDSVRGPQSFGMITWTSAR
jgi:hypothetical protein